MSDTSKEPLYATRESINWEASFERMKAERDALRAELAEVRRDLRTAQFRAEGKATEWREALEQLAAAQNRPNAATGAREAVRGGSADSDAADRRTADLIEEAFEVICKEEPLSGISRSDIRQWVELFSRLGFRRQPVTPELRSGDGVADV